MAFRYPPVRRVAETVPMKNWKQLAAALEAPIPDADLARIEPALNGLEQMFRPLISTLPIETEPAYVLLVTPEADE